jgi:hypothetical protein
LNLLIDLNCDALNPNYTIAMTRNLRSRLKNQWNSYEVKKTDIAFRTPLGKGGMPSADGNARPAPLTRLTTAHPFACFVSADVFDLGMKRGQRLAPVILAHGDSFYVKPSKVRIDDIQMQIGESTFVEDFEL